MALVELDRFEETWGAKYPLIKMLYLVTMDVTRKWTGRVQNWGQMLLQLSVFFPDRIGQHLP